MIFPEYSEFVRLADRGNFVPVYRECIADLDTPVSAWYKVCAGRPYSFLLESIEGGERLGRYSFLGCDPLWVLVNRGDRTEKIYRDGTTQQLEGNPFRILAEDLQCYRPVTLPQLPPGIGGLFGFWGYELIRWIEPRVPVGPRTEDDLPDGVWMQVDSLLILDRVKRKIWVIAYADLRAENAADAYARAKDRVEGLARQLQTPLDETNLLLPWRPPQSIDTTNLRYESNKTKEEFCAIVERARAYIRAGDIFQTVLSQRLSAEFSGDPFRLYRSLQTINPSPYMAFFRFDDWYLIGSSPEVMVKAENKDGKQIATVRPIAGTRPRGKTPVEDAAYAEDLLRDPKERAEHVMLVDLGRNDLGRVCASGSVRADELMIVERYSHVMHIVSNVIGELNGDKTAWDLLEACFPAGTVSGAPKIRAMEIIHELEQCRRGPYSGVYGYYDFEGQLNTAITIRTAIARPRGGDRYLISVQAGAGIVADSQPEKEYEETLNKARGLLEAICCLEM